MSNPEALIGGSPYLLCMQRPVSHGTRDSLANFPRSLAVPLLFSPRTHYPKRHPIFCSGSIHLHSDCRRRDGDVGLCRNSAQILNPRGTLAFLLELMLLFGPPEVMSTLLPGVILQLSVRQLNIWLNTRIRPPERGKFWKSKHSWLDCGNAFFVDHSREFISVYLIWKETEMTQKPSKRFELF